MSAPTYTLVSAAGDPIAYRVSAAEAADVILQHGGWVPEMWRAPLLDDAHGIGRAWTLRVRRGAIVVNIGSPVVYGPDEDVAYDAVAEHVVRLTLAGHPRAIPTREWAEIEAERERQGRLDAESERREAAALRMAQV